MKYLTCPYFYLLFFLLPVWGRADHITGGEMYYSSLGVSNGNAGYQVTLRLLMRCNSGRMFPNPITVSVFSNGDNQRVMDILVALTNQQQISLGSYDPCISNPPNVCYEVAEYFFPVSLPVNVAGYTMAASVNFRVNGLANLEQVGNVGATYTADIPGSAVLASGEKNSSARFTGSDLVVVCANSPFKYSFGATDADGDKLEYYFCGAYQSGISGGGGPNALQPIQPPYPEVPYGFPYGPSMPLGGGVTIDQDEGLVSGIAPDIGIYVITVCVAEKRNGKVIAVQRKDIQLNITGCTVAAAILKPSYQLCSDSDELTFENFSLSPLIQSYSWRLVGRNGSTVSTASTPRFTYKFTDTGLYKVVLQTNVGLACPDSSSADVRYYPGFKVDFTFQGLCFGNPTKFFNSSSTRYGSFDKYYWSLGETGNPSNIQDKATAELTYGVVGEKMAFFRVSNTNGCIDSIAHLLVVSTNPPLSLNFKDTLICIPDTLELAAKGDGEFTWSSAPGILSATNGPRLKVAPTVTTNYVVTQNLDKCIGRDTIRVRVTDRVLLSLMDDTTICTGDAIILRSSGNGNVFQWTPPAGLATPLLGQSAAALFQTTRFTLKASISKCSAQANVVVTTVPYPTVSAGQDVAICFGASANLSAVSNGNRFMWQPANTLSNPLILNPVATPKETTSYIIEVFADEGCPKPSYDTILVQVEPPILLKGTGDTTIVIGQPLNMQVTGAPKFIWKPSAYVSNAEIGNPVIRFTSPTDSTRFKVIGYNEAGCSDSLEFTVRVFSTEPSVFVPTAFTPNGDGLNETLKPILAGMKQLDFFRVYNRYGQLVFETNQDGVGWDGRLKGQLQPSGLFVWVVNAVDYLGGSINAKGSAMLIR